MNDNSAHVAANRIVTLTPADRRDLIENLNLLDTEDRETIRDNIAEILDDETRRGLILMAERDND